MFTGLSKLSTKWFFKFISITKLLSWLNPYLAGIYKQCMGLSKI